VERERLEAAVPDGEALRYGAERRRSPGAVGFTDERLLVVDQETTSVEFEAIEEVAARDVDWFVAVLSVATVGVGLVAGLDRPLVGVGLVAAGVVSLVLTYRKRGQVTVSVRGRGKPLQFYLSSTDEFLDRLETRLDRYEERLAAEHGTD
jgi:hypothetical protein